jgi:hypothetical protein
MVRKIKGKRISKRMRKKLRAAYLTKRMVASAANNAVRHASKRALNTAGHILVIKAGWLVQKNADGSCERIKKIRIVKRPAKIVLY